MKKLLSILLVLMLVLSLVPTAAFADDGEDPIPKPDLMVTGSETADNPASQDGFLPVSTTQEVDSDESFGNEALAGSIGGDEQTGDTGRSKTSDDEGGGNTGETGSGNVGGVVGSDNGGSVSNVYNTGSVDGETVTVDPEPGSDEITVTLPNYTVTLSASPAEGGTVTGGGSYADGASVTVTATAAEGYTFVSWRENGNVVSTNASYTFDVTNDRTLTAKFNFSVTVPVDPEPGSDDVIVTIDPDPDPADITVTVPSFTVTYKVTGGTWADGTTADKTETVDFGYSPATVPTGMIAVSGYTGGAWDADPSIVAITEDTTFTYSFTVDPDGTTVTVDPEPDPANITVTLQEFTVTLSAYPAAGGTVTGAGTYSDGDTVTVSAVAYGGYRFDHWKRENGSTINDAEFTFVIHENHTYEAVFVEDSTNVSSYTLVMPDSITISPNAETTAFTVNVTALDLRPNASGNTPESLRVKVNAATLVNQSDTEKTILFKLCPYDTTVGTSDTLYFKFESSQSKSGYIVITASQWNAVTPGVYTGSMTYQPYYQYSNGDAEWLETVKSIPITLTIPEPATSYIVTVNNGSGGGEYAEGASVTITADEPEEGKQFKEWTATGITLTDEQKTAASLTFTMPANAVTVTATYEDIYTVTVSVNDESMGTASADLASGATGTEVTLTVTPNDGYQFKEWNVTSGGVTIADYKFTIGTADVAVQAVFEVAATYPDYTVCFDANVPASASTTSTGSMANQSFTYNETKALSANGYSLPGYDFEGWNTKADGTGTAYANKAEVQGLSENGGTVVLYAQWSGKPYTIWYWSDEDGTKKHVQTAYFDRSGKLDVYSDASFWWDSDGKTLHGWTVTGSGSFLEDGDDFVNLCGAPDADGNVADPIIVADWVNNGQIIVTITKDGVPQEGMEDHLELAQGTSTFMIPVAYANGKYVFRTSSIPDGEYDLLFEANGYPPASERITYGEEHAVSVVFDYYTVSLTKDPSYADFNDVEISGGVPVAGMSNTVIRRDGDMLSIKTTVASGYRFVGYTAIGVAPAWEGGDPTKANQVITVRGKVDITAQVEPIGYTVTVEGGTADTTTAHAGDTVTITANDAEYGYAFVQWAQLEGVDFAQGDGFTTTFTMPAKDVTISAVFKAISLPDIPDKIYTGEEITPTFGLFGVTLDGVDGVYSGKYVLSYENNVNAGTATVTLTFKDSVTGEPDARLGKKSTTFEILPAKLTITGVSAADKVYDSTTDATIDSSSATVSGLVSGDDVTLDYTGAFEDANVGSGKPVAVTVTLSGEAAGNYEIDSVNSPTADITKRTLTITARDQEYVYNGQIQGEGDTAYEDPAEIAEKVMVSGLQGSDALTSIILDGQGQDVGEYELVPSNATIGEATANYAIAYVNGKLTISCPHTDTVTDPAVPPTCTGTGLTEGKHCSVCGDVLVAQEEVPALGHTPASPVEEKRIKPTCTTAGSYDVVVYCSVCGEELQRDHKTIPAVGHQYSIIQSTITRVWYRCENCKDTYWIYNGHSKNMLPGLVRNENGENVDYTAGVSRKDGKRILTVTPDSESAANCAELWLYLNPDDVLTWINEGIDTVAFSCGDACLEIELKEVSPDWFAPDVPEAIDFFLFAVIPESDGFLVDVEALHGEEKLPAKTLTGLILKTGDIAEEVKENGVYAKPKQ